MSRWTIRWDYIKSAPFFLHIIVDGDTAIVIESMVCSRGSLVLSDTDEAVIVCTRSQALAIQDRYISLFRGLYQVEPVMEA